MTPRPLSVRGARIGTGRPKIIVPLTAPDLPQLLDEAAALAGHPLDLVEWRIDHFAPETTEVGPYTAAVLDGARRLRAALDAADPPGPALPILLTLRTAAEGGAREVSAADYRQVLADVCSQRVVELIDVEAFAGEDARAIIAAAHAAEIAVIGSNHHVDATPAEDEIISRLRRMQELGADVVKLAAKPHDPGDVLTLLHATWAMHSRYAEVPLITMSMGPLGVVTRVAGGTFGSAATFGTVGAASAPGQIGVEQLATAMDALAS